MPHCDAKYFQSVSIDFYSTQEKVILCFLKCGGMGESTAIVFLTFELNEEDYILTGQ